MGVTSTRKACIGEHPHLHNGPRPHRIGYYTTGRPFCKGFGLLWYSCGRVAEKFFRCVGFAPARRFCFLPRLQGWKRPWRPKKQTGGRKTSIKEEEERKMFKIILAIVVTSVAMLYSLNTDSKFRITPDESIPKKTQLFIQRKSGFIGLGILPVPLLLAFGKYQLSLFFLLIGLVGILIFIPVILMAKFPLVLWLLACAVIGTSEVTRAVLLYTLVGKPVVDRVDFINRYGMEAYLKMCVQQAERNKTTAKQPGLFEALFWGPQATDGLTTMYIKNEFGVQDSRTVLVQNGRYLDPKDGQWHNLPN